MLISHELPPVGGGGANATANLAREMARGGDAVTVLTGRFRGQPAREERDGYAVVRVPVLRRRMDRSSPPEMATFALSAGLRALVGLERPDVAVAFFGFPAGPVAAVLRALRGVPYVVSLRGGDVPGHQPAQLATAHRLLRPALVRLWRSAAAVVAPSHGLAALARRSAPELDVHVVPNGVSCEVFAPPAVSTDEGTALRLLYAGRLGAEKGLGILPSVLARLDGLPWILDIVGDGPERARLRTAFDAAGFDGRVRFRGWLGREAMPDAYRATDVFLFPSSGEGMPNTVLEAMASGLPVVAVRATGTDEVVVDGETGFLCDAGDAMGLARCVDVLAADRGLRLCMGQAARQRAARDFSWRRGAETYAELCRAAVREALPHMA
nr:glycosyltransferase family 4 protein [Desulfobaculum xiamenense]